MKTLRKGIEILCNSDADINRLITPRYDEIVSLLERYINEIELFNKAYGLVKVNNTEELVIKHILDSLAPLGIISRLLPERQSLNIADAGSGAGLPGIPLAITLPQCNFTLIERMGRRAGFLLNTMAVLSAQGQRNITVEEKELEKTEGGRFNFITFRAFKPIEPRLLKTLFKSCTQGGIIAAYKGRSEKIKEEIALLKDFYGKWDVISYKVPFLDKERNLLTISNFHDIIIKSN